MMFFDNVYASVYEESLIAEFLSNTAVNGDCLDWIGTTTPRGYGTFRFLGATWAAHRIAYLMFVGPLGDSQVVRHTCDRPVCVEPSHLIAGTQKDNIKDQLARGRHASQRPTCKRGHPWTDENTYIAPKTGKRGCRKCRKATSQKARNQKVSK